MHLRSRLPRLDRAEVSADSGVRQGIGSMQSSMIFRPLPRGVIGGIMHLTQRPLVAMAVKGSRLGLGAATAACVRPASVPTVVLNEVSRSTAERLDHVQVPQIC